MNTRYFKRLERYPPSLVRLLARDDTSTALTDKQLSKICPLPILRSLSISTDWKLATVEEIDLFLTACRADPGDPVWVRQTNRLLKSKWLRWTWLYRSPQREYFIEVMKVYASSAKHVT